VTSADRRIRRDPRPLYQRAAEAMLQLIDDQRLEEGSPFPSEVELSQMFGVGRSTVREALSYLESEGFIARRRGVGTTVLAGPAKAALGLEILEPFEELAERQGWQCGTTSVSVAAGGADKLEAHKLDISPGDPITLIRRTKTRDGSPIAVMDSVVPAQFMPSDLIERKFVDSITLLLSERMFLTHAVAEVSIAMCTPVFGERLGREAGSPLLALYEVFWAGDVGPVSWNSSYLVPGAMRLELLRRRPRSRPLGRGGL
jgi:DNA-binding GntR family transcriptional regulator